MPLNFLALDYISLHSCEIHEAQSTLKTSKTISLTEIQKNLNDNSFFFHKNQNRELSENLTKIKNPNTYESNIRKNKNIKLKYRKKLTKQKSDAKSLPVKEKKKSYIFNESEFDEWLMMENKDSQSLDFKENEEFDKFISGTLFVESNEIDSSPSYSPLESICNEFPNSQIIELDIQLKKRLETGIEKIQNMTIDSYIGSMENLNIYDRKIEIVVESDDESPWFDMNPFEIIDDYFKDLKSKNLAHENLEKLTQSPKQSQINDENINEDYLYRFSECLELVKEMLDIIERKSNNEFKIKIENEIEISRSSTEKLIEKPVSNGSKLYYSVPSSITITKLNVDPYMNTLKSCEYLSIQNNEIYLKMNYYHIENLFSKIIQDCQNELKLNCKMNELSVDLIKKMIEKNLNKNHVPFYLLLQCCLESLDLLFNCSWSSFFKNIKNYLHNYHFMPEIKNSLSVIFKEIEKKQLHIDQKYSRVDSPKILILLKYIQDESEKAKDSKFLIIVPRRSIELDDSFICQMKSLSDVKSCFFYIEDSSDIAHFNYLKSKYDCLVVNYNTLIHENLSSFTHLIVYECLKNAILFNHNENFFESCQKLNIRYIEFESYKINLYGLSNIEMERAIICSQRVANNTFLVEYIETELGIKLITRNYDYITMENRLNNLIICNADFLVNEKVGIIFQECSQFLNYFEEEINLFFKKLVNFRFSLTNLFIILTYSETKESNFKFLNHQNISRFLNFCKDSNQNHSSFLLTPIFAQDLESIKYFLKKILDNFLHEGNFLNFTNEPTLEEQFLVSLGCFNSINAQLILQSCSLTDLVSFDFDKFKAKFEFIDDEKIDFFLKILEVNEDK